MTRILVELEKELLQLSSDSTDVPLRGRFYSHAHLRKGSYREPCIHRNEGLGPRMYKSGCWEWRPSSELGRLCGPRRVGRGTAQAAD